MRERGFADGVMAAGQHGNVVIPILPARAFNHFAREMYWEGCVIAAVYKFGPLFLRAEQVPVARRANAEPELP